MNKNQQFPDHQLDVYTVSLQALKLAKSICDDVPRGYRSFADQLLRSTGSVTLNICECANGRTRAERRNAYGIARKEAGEAAGTIEALVIMDLVGEDKAKELHGLLYRLNCMLKGLIEKQ